ncbi:MAG: RDD family protein [Phycisphaerae bacterium]|nr:RDD family protein [Phycisphaerae bacterium]
MDWYYAVGGERFGPFSKEAFDQMVQQGRITGVTLVWREGLDDWVQYQFLAGPGADGTQQSMVSCSQCHRHAVSDDMVQYQGHWVCSECKNTFYQRVREGGVTMQEVAGTARLRFAGFWIRVGAGILDILILIVAYVAVGLVANMIQNASGFSFSVMMWVQLMVSLAQLVIFLFYVTWFLGKFGATPGKMACGLKVRLSNGRKISFARAFGRAWAAILGLLIAYITLLIMLFLAAFGLSAALGPRPSAVVGLIAIVSIVGGLLSLFPFYMAGMTRQKCALHDFICNTRVVHAK